MDQKPLLNAWTEFGVLEACIVGAVHNNDCNFEPEPNFRQDFWCFPEFSKYMHYPMGSRSQQSIKRAQSELENLKDVLEAELVKVYDSSYIDEYSQKNLPIKATKIGEGGDFQKQKVTIYRPKPLEPRQYIKTPWWDNFYQYGTSNPRDPIIVLGDTLIEAPMCHRCRYFESYSYRDIIYDFWKKDKKMKWIQAPKPTMADSMFIPEFWTQFDEKQRTEYFNQNKQSALLENEMAFDAADISKVGKDIFIRISQTANRLAADWLRRQFPHLRVHLTFHKNDYTRHNDCHMVPVKPPTQGSEGIVLNNAPLPPSEEQLQLWKRNGWKVYEAPNSVSFPCSPVSKCKDLSVNFLSLSPTSVIIEESELQLYNILTDLGIDVITCPLRSINEYGGSVHCSTLDLRRDDECKDYFPDQDYEKEVELNMIL